MDTSTTLLILGAMGVGTFLIVKSMDKPAAAATTPVNNNSGGGSNNTGDSGVFNDLAGLVDFGTQIGGLFA